MDESIKTQLERADKARNFPINTCAASRHVQQIGEALTIGECDVLHEDWETVAESMLSVVAALWEARTEIERLRAGFRAIQKATIEGRVCDDVAWFDEITTLHDFCDQFLPEDK